MQKKQKQTKSKIIKKVKPHTPVPEAKIDLKKLQAELKASKNRIIELEIENQQLKEKLNNPPKEILKIHGWAIVQRKAGGGNNLYWYAGKSINGKMEWIYLGKELDLANAKKKIEQEKR